MSRWLRARLDPPARLSEDEVRALWRFRLEQIRLKPDVPPERDWGKFSRLVGQCAFVVRLFADKALAGFYIIWLRDGEVEGRRYRWIAIEYGFIAPRWRGHPSSALAYLWVLAKVWSPRLGVLHYAGGVGYPTSAMSLAALGPTLRLYHDPDTTPVEARIFEVMLQDMADGACPPGEGVWLPTLPHPLSERWLASRAGSPQFARYLARSPRWSEGYGWPVLVPVLPAQVFRGVARRLQRRLHAALTATTTPPG